MFKFRNLLVVIGMLFYTVAFADVQVSIGINVPVYPRLVIVPGYPVYYAPQLNSNYFFYDGLYWVFQDNDWYQSSWYNGPWWLVYPEDVPLFILRVPVRYYRLQPTFFFGWSSVSAPRWGEHWGRDWEQRRNGWDEWDRKASHTPAPLPSYQRQYSGDRYPRQIEQQHELQKKSYRYEPRDPVVQQHYQKQEEQRSPAQQVNPTRESSQQEKQRSPEEKGVRQQDNQRSAPQQQTTPRKQDERSDQRLGPPQKRNNDAQKSMPAPAQQERRETQENRQRKNQQTEPRQQNSSEAEATKQQEQKSQGKKVRQQGRETQSESTQEREQNQEQEQGRTRSKGRNE
jgi:hypothetical protein